MVANGWQLFYFKPFKAALDEIEHAITKLAKQNPAGHRSHPKTRLLASIYKASHKAYLPIRTIQISISAKR